MKIISIVVPVYNEQENIIHFYREICNIMETTKYDFQLFFVNDGSGDASAALIRELEEKDTHVKGLFLARNFGHQVALTCGLDYANGDAVITMDGDMQHPPELIPILLEKWEAGFEVVQTIRETTEGVSWIKKLTSSCYYKILNNMADIHIQEGGSDFRLMDQVVVRSFRRYKEQARFIRGMIGAMGYKQTQIEFVAPKRFAGTSKFSPRKMLHFALDGITAYSNLPLRLSLYGGLLSGLISFLLVLHVLFIKLFTFDAVPGWATIAASILFLGGIQLTVLGIIGEYIGRIFAEVKQRPLYLLEREPENEIKK